MERNIVPDCWSSYLKGLRTNASGNKWYFKVVKVIGEELLVG
jgi:hypothetical protein